MLVLGQLDRIKIADIYYPVNSAFYRQDGRYKVYEIHVENLQHFKDVIVSRILDADDGIFYFESIPVKLHRFTVCPPENMLTLMLNNNQEIEVIERARDESPVLQKEDNTTTNYNN